jgi:hypothetical protein
MATVFSGRLIFDHLEKTAGQALNAWLRSELGISAVTEPLIGTHRDLIKMWGGDYSMIFGHVQFDGTGIDPRYRYITLLRDPIERALSQMFFVLNNHAPDSVPEWRAYEKFLNSEGDIVEFPVLQKMANYHVDHFASVESRLHRPVIAKLADAQAALDRYDVWGFYEQMPDFLGDLSRFLGVPAPKSLTPVNVTVKKPRAEDVSPKLRARLMELNALDLTFYRVAQKRYSTVRAGFSSMAPPNGRAWEPYERHSMGRAESSHLSLVAATTNRPSGIVMSGGEIAFRLTIDLPRPVAELIAGIHIHNEQGWQAFGTNSAMLEKPLRNLGAGSHQLEFRVAASLPEGRYRVGFAFLESAADGMRTLAWLDRVVTFETRIVRDVPSIGACAMSASFDHVSAVREVPAALPARRGLFDRFRGAAQSVRAGS